MYARNRVCGELHLGLDSGESYLGSFGPSLLSLWSQNVGILRFFFCFGGGAFYTPLFEALLGAQLTPPPGELRIVVAGHGGKKPLLNPAIPLFLYSEFNNPCLSEWALRSGCSSHFVHMYPALLKKPTLFQGSYLEIHIYS